MDIKEKIEELRAELHRHNYNYYVLNAPEISDKDFDDKMRELQDLEQAYPEYCLWQIHTLKAKSRIFMSVYERR